MLSVVSQRLRGLSYRLAYYDGTNTTDTTRQKIKDLALNILPYFCVFHEVHQWFRHVTSNEWLRKL